MGRLFARLILLIALVLIPAFVAVVFTARILPAKLTLKETHFTAIPGWDDAGFGEAFGAFLKSCDKLEPRPGFLIPEDFRTEAYQRAFDDACAKAREGEDFYAASDEAAKGFFEDAFRPYNLKMGFSRRGKITGYYEPLIEASFDPGPDYPWPLYAAPDDQVTIDLSKFRDDLKGTLTGRLEGSRVVPYYTRKDISEGALSGKGLEILYVKDPIDVYFLQVQGSGRGKLADGTIIGVGYAGKNGHINTLAGRTLVKAGEMELEDVSMPAIRQWFADHPGRVFEILHQDNSYVFFQITGGDGPFGSSGAVLTAGHSLAVDPGFLPMGLPVFIDGDIPVEGAVDEKQNFQDLLIAQDTGGAIKGALRADIFWGQGPRASFLAGHMNNEAAFILLLPKGALGDE